MSVEEAKDLVRRMYDLLNQGKIDACYELFAPQYVYHHINGGMNVKAAKEHEVEWFRAFADVQVTIDDMVAEGDKVVVRVTWKGTHTGNGFGWTPTGNKINITNSNTFRIIGDRITELWNVCDLRLLQQISLPPTKQISHLRKRELSIEEFAEKWTKTYIEALQTGNCDKLEILEDPDIVHHNVSRGQIGIAGWEAHKQAITNMRQAIPNIKMNLQYLIGEGNLFAVSYKARGMFTGHAQDWPPPTGKELILSYLYLFRTNRERITEAWYTGTITNID